MGVSLTTSTQHCTGCPRQYYSACVIKQVKEIRRIQIAKEEVKFSFK